MNSYDINTCRIDVSKHFRNKYMRNWNWDLFDLREAIKNAYKVEKTGKVKYEAYTMKGGSKKIIFVYDKEFNTIIVISGAEKK